MAAPLATIEAGPSTAPEAPQVIPAAPRSMRAYEPRAPLVSQVDADSLDGGIAELLGDGLERAIGRFKPASMPDLKPEITLALKLLIFSVGVLGPRTASPGAQLQNLRLSSSRHAGKPTRRTLLLYLVLHPPLLPNYLLNRMRQTALSRQWPDLPSHDWRRKTWNLIVRLENIARAWELAGWLWFLWDGRFPSILMRILGLQLVPSQARLARMVSYEFMNRQLVWGVMTEFLIFALPRVPSLPNALNPATLTAPVKAFFSQPTTIDYEALNVTADDRHAARRAGAPAPAAAHAGVLAGIPRTTCPVCYLKRTSRPAELPGTDIELPQLEVDADPEGDAEDRVFIPAQGDCWGGCKYCYYCLADELAKHEEEVTSPGNEKKKKEKWTCLRCGGGITRAWRGTAQPWPEAPVETSSESEVETSAESSSSDSEHKWPSGIGAMGSESDIDASWMMA